MATPFSIRALAYGKGITLTDLARQCKVSTAMVSRFFGGDVVSRPFTERAAGILGVTPEELLSMISKDRRAA